MTQPQAPKMRKLVKTNDEFNKNQSQNKRPQTLYGVLNSFVDVFITVNYTTDTALSINHTNNCNQATQHELHYRSLECILK